MDQHYEPYIRNKRDLQVPYISCPDYMNYEEVGKLIPSFKQINQEDKKLDQQQKAFAFVLRSNNDDDIHKSIKYGIWTSSKENNDKLNARFKEAQEKGLNVYLFYSVVKSGQFVGVAQLISGYKEESFQYWWEVKKWKGHFDVQWVYVKDIVNKSFDHLKNVQDHYSSLKYVSDLVEVTRSRDGVQVDWEKSGREMLQIFEKAPSERCILKDFGELDQREQALRQYKHNLTTQRNGYYGQQYQQQQAFYPQYNWQYQHQQYY